MRRVYTSTIATNEIRASLERSRYPRTAMAVIVAITGCAGFLSSFLLLNLGMTELWLRYLVALGLAYIVFLILIWIWLHSNDKGSDLDLPDWPGPGGSTHDAPFQGGGGHSGGGGASSSFDVSPDSSSIDVPGIGDVAEAVSGADEFAIPLFVVIAAVAVLATLAIGSVWIVIDAPAFFAELLLDAALAGGFYRRLLKVDRKHWLLAVTRLSLLYFTVTALLFLLFAWALNAYDPSIHSLGELIRRI